MKVKKQTLDDFLRVSRRYWQSGDADLIHAMDAYAEQLRDQMRPGWFFTAIRDTLSGMHRVTEVSNEQIYKALEALGIEVEG